MHLVCSRRCGGTLFRVLFVEVDVNPAGEYQEHRVTQPGYLCLNCGAPAIDLGAVPQEMQAAAEEEEKEQAAVVKSDILCPVCETLVQVGDEMECPNCGSPLEVA